MKKQISQWQKALVLCLAVTSVSAFAERSTNTVGFAVVTVNPGVNVLANPFNTGSNQCIQVLGGLLADSKVQVWNAEEQAYASASAAITPGDGFFLFYQGNQPTNLVLVGQVVPGPGETFAKGLAGDSGYTLLGLTTPSAISTNEELVGLSESDGARLLAWDAANVNWTDQSAREELALGRGLFYRAAQGSQTGVWQLASTEPQRAGKLGLSLQRSGNGKEVLLTLSGADPKTYVVVTKSNFLDTQWVLESKIDASLTLVAMISLGSRDMGFFEVVSEEEFNADATPADQNNATGANGKNVRQSAGSGRDWFVDRAHGRDDLDGHAKNRNGSNGPFASVRKAMTHAAAGDRVIIAAGMYAENLDLRGKNIAVKLEGNVILH